MNFLETRQGRFELRDLAGLAELAEAEQVQLDVWGQDTLPEGRELLLAVQHAGGLVGGAFAEGGALAGLVFAFPCRGAAAQHSHRLAVRPAWRGLGLGAALKWFQRAWCLERGVRFVEWTVDPLRMPNAELNAGVLGAQTNSYLLDYYGAMQGIDAGLPSDRFFMRWDLASPRVSALAGGALPEAANAGAPLVNPGLDGSPGEARLDLEAEALLVRIPPDFMRLSAQDRPLALAWRMQTRQIFQYYFARGYAVSGFRSAPGPAYLLERSAL